MLSAVGLSGLFGGCVPVPYPIPPLGYTQSSRHNLTDQVPAFISEGKTTRAEVLFKLGEPDTDGTFVYTSAYRHGGVGVTLIGGNSFPAANEQRTTYRRLTIIFDDNGVVTSARMDIKTCWLKSSASDVFSNWESSSSCMPAGDSNTPKASGQDAVR